MASTSLQAVPPSTLRNLRPRSGSLLRVRCPYSSPKQPPQESPFLISKEIASANSIPKTNVGALPLANGGTLSVTP